MPPLATPPLPRPPSLPLVTQRLTTQRRLRHRATQSMAQRNHKYDVMALLERRTAIEAARTKMLARSMEKVD